MIASGPLLQLPDAPDSSQFHCSRCGYDLRTLSSNAVCPECGYPIAASMQSPFLPLTRASRVRRALSVAVAASLLCASSLILTWLYLRYWFPLSRAHPSVLPVSLGRITWHAIISIDTAGGITRYLAVLLLLRAVSPSKIAGVSSWISWLLLGAAIFTLTVSWPLSAALPRSKVGSDLFQSCHAGSPAALWFGSLVAWIRLRTTLRTAYRRWLLFPTILGIAASALMFASSIAYLLAAARDPNWFVESESPLWKNRFLTWSPNGILETLVEVLYLLALLLLLRRLHRLV